MPNFCIVVGCSSNAARDAAIKFFRVPSVLTKSRKVPMLAVKRRDAWVRAIKRVDLTETKIKYCVCSKHFHTGQPALPEAENHVDWVPSKNMGHRTSHQTQTKDVGWYFRFQKRAVAHEMNS